MRILLVTIFLFCLLFSHDIYAQSNDHMFPAADVAKPYINFDNKGFIINRKRTFLVSAGMEYARVPRALWKDRLQRLKMAGFNCIEIYTFWNYHEPQEGKFNFSGDHDLNAFLQLVHQMGMYCIARVGPYYCAEWDFGGYPIWIRFKEGLKVREPNVVFEKCVDHFFDTLMPIICRNQINNGGSVILIQLENEHLLGWGTAMPNSYFEHLRSYSLSKGMQVPYFFSGVHHSSDPAGEDYKLDDAKRPNPWFSTEFWSVWYNDYNSTEKDAKTYARRTWKIIAGGGGGYNYYMAHGGSNFGYTNNDEDAASYDYGAAIGQAGDLRPVYFAMKEAALFARSFEDILANGTDATSQYSSLVTDTSVRVTARKSNAGDIVFIDNRKNEPKQVTVMDKTIHLDGGEIYPLVHNYQLSKEVKIDWSFTRIYSLYKQGNTTNIILTGNKNEEAAIDFLINPNASIITKEKVFSVANHIVHFTTTIPQTEPKAYSFTCSNQTIRIICLTHKIADKTWLFNKENQAFIVSGADYVSDINTKGNSISVTAELPWQNDTSSAWLFTQKGFTKLNQTSSNKTHLASLALSSWQYKSANQPIEKEFDDSHWLQSKNPAQMGADGDTTADAWYRTTINIPEDNTYTLQVDGGGRAKAYIDGKYINSWEVQNGEVTIPFTKGTHTFSAFVAHDGRDKFFSYMGAVDSTASKGLFGEARLMKGDKAIQTLSNWKYVLAKDKDVVNSAIPAETSQWQPYTIGQDVFHNKQGYAWFQTQLPLNDYKGGKAILFFKSVDENATVFINHQQVAKHKGWNQKFYITLDHLDTIKAPVYLNVFIENYDNEGGIDQPVTLNLIPEDVVHITNWKMKGGTGNEFSHTWNALNDTKQHNLPVFYQSHFTVDSSVSQGTIWRIVTKGLGHGSVWVNGNNLGRYPEKIPAPGMYVPECWLKTGENTIVVYDEDGKAPTEVKLQTETAASRDVIKLTTQASSKE